MSETDGAQIAYGNVLDADPAWQSLTRVSGWDMRVGRTDEFTRTNTGTATIYVNDLTGYLGAGAEIPVHGQISLRGSPMYRGFVDDINVVVAPSGVVSRVAIELVDAFDVLTGIEVADATPVVFGDTVPVGSEGNVYYAAQQVDNRIIDALDDAEWPASLRNIFSGNVNVRPKVYDPGSTIMQIISDAADAEFPTVANLFVDRGIIRFRGRFARFTPGAYGIPTWQAGTGSNVTSGVAQMRVLEYRTSKQQVYNSALCFPQAHPDELFVEQIVIDSTSIAKWGVRSWSAENIQTLRHNANGNTGADECLLFAQYVVENYSNPVPRISRVAFKSLRDTDARAAATWALMQGVAIGDVIEITTDWISGTYFVEGITARARELDGTIPFAEVELDLSPAANWTVDPF